MKYIYVHTYIHIHTYISVSLYTYIHTYKSIYVHIYLRTYIYIYEDDPDCCVFSFLSFFMGSVRGSRRRSARLVTLNRD